MFVLRSNEKVPVFYISMIGGLIVNVSSSRKAAKAFRDLSEAQAERKKFERQLKSFVVEEVSHVEYAT
jgi:hypothetical protein